MARSVYGLLSEIRTLNDDFPWLSFIGTDGLFPKLKKIAGQLLDYLKKKIIFVF